MDEALPAEPEVDPDVMPAEPSAPPAPSRPAPRRRPDPFTVPPDFEPGQMPRPKAEDETGSIEAWLEATQQPITDWEWNGEELRLLMQDGSTETYTRQQLDEIGVLGQMSFAEAVEDPQEVQPPPENMGEEPSMPDFDGDDGLDMDPELAQHLEIGDEDGAGTLDTILGRNCAGGAPEGGREGEAEVVINLDPEASQELTQAVSDVVAAILGTVGQALGGEGGEAPEGDKSSDKDADKKPDKKKKKDGEKDDKSKEKGEKSKDKEADKEADKKDDSKPDKE
jgi:hypothetical protein